MEQAYKDLIDELDNCLATTDLIEEYQKLQAENKRLKKENEDLEDDLYKEESYTTTNSSGETVTETREVKNEFVERKIDKNLSKIRSNERLMNSKKNQIDLKLNNY